MGELSGVADLLVDVETSQIAPHADARQRSGLPRADVAPLASCAANVCPQVELSKAKWGGVPGTVPQMVEHNGIV